MTTNPMSSNGPGPATAQPKRDPKDATPGGRSIVEWGAAGGFLLAFSAVYDAMLVYAPRQGNARAVC